jgi:hypothetical protein
VVPHDGAWTLIGLQGFFPEYKVGTLTVPGPLRVLSPPALAHGHKGDWGAVRPQIVDSEHAAAGHTHAGPPEAATGAVGEDAPRERDAVPLMPALVVGLTLVVLLAVGWVLHARPAVKGRYGLPGGQADLRHPSMWGMLVDRLPYQPSGAYPLRLAETPASAAARSSTPPA